MMTLKKTQSTEGIESLLLGYEQEVERKRGLSDFEKNIALRDYSKELQFPSSNFIVIKKDQKPVGFVSYSIKKNNNGNHYADLSRFFIEAEHRKKGLRKNAEETLKLFFKKTGITYMVQTVESTNKDYISSLKKTGYMQIGRYYDDKERREWFVYMRYIQNGNNGKRK